MKKKKEKRRQAIFWGKGLTSFLEKTKDIVLARLGSARRKLRAFLSENLAR
jgi:hypothetical protein